MFGYFLTRLSFELFVLGGFLPCKLVIHEEYDKIDNMNAGCWIGRII